MVYCGSLKDFPYLTDIVKQKADRASTVCFALLCHLVKFNGKLALFVRCGIFVNDSAGCSLINLLDCFLISLGCNCFVAALERRVILLDDGMQLRLKNAVLKRFRLDDLHALLCGFDVRHEVHLLQKSEYEHQPVPERVHTAKLLIYEYLYYHRSSEKARDFFQKIKKCAKFGVSQQIASLNNESRR